MPETETMRAFPAETTQPGLAVPAAEGDIERLVNGQHHDPHSVLGAHPLPAGAAGEEAMLVRAWRPDGAGVTLLAGEECHACTVGSPGPHQHCFLAGGACWQRMCPEHGVRVMVLPVDQPLDVPLGRRYRQARLGGLRWEGSLRREAAALVWQPQGHAGPVSDRRASLSS